MQMIPLVHVLLVLWYEYNYSTHLYNIGGVTAMEIGGKPPVKRSRFKEERMREKVWLNSWRVACKIFTSMHFICDPLVSGFRSSRGTLCRNGTLVLIIVVVAWTCKLNHSVLYVPHTTGQDTHITKVLADIQVNLPHIDYTSSPAKFYLLGLIIYIVHGPTYMCVVPLDKR